MKNAKNNGRNRGRKKRTSIFGHPTTLGVLDFVAIKRGMEQDILAKYAVRIENTGLVKVICRGGIMLDPPIYLDPWTREERRISNDDTR